MTKVEFKVKNFEYNGFCGKDLPGFADYTVVFKKWTKNPGVGVFKCSDGKERLIPSFALFMNGARLTHDMEHGIPEQPRERGKEGKMLFGSPCKS